MTAGTIPARCETQEGRDEFRRRIHGEISELVSREAWSVADLERGRDLVEGLNELDDLEPGTPCRSEPAEFCVG
jgi:hypothetical protein